jgi:hypothetical protein
VREDNKPRRTFRSLAESNPSLTARLVLPVASRCDYVYDVAGNVDRGHKHSGGFKDW